MSDIINAYSIKLINSLLITMIFLGGYLLSRFFLTKRIKNKKLRSQYIIRAKYFFFIVFMIFFIKIWVEGFKGIFSFLGFVSAAFTLTQRENLMNMVGWLIINWRGLFSEGDHIRISNFSGCVKSIGILYFTLIENNPDSSENISGRIVKVPNGMVSRNPIMNFSQEKFVEGVFRCVFKPNSDFDEIDKLYLELEQEMESYLASHRQVGDKSTLEDYNPSYSVNIRQEKPAGYEMVFLFYCKYVDMTPIQHQLSRRVISFTTRHPDLILAFD